jgi:hypothetical protein
VPPVRRRVRRRHRPQPQRRQLRRARTRRRPPPPTPPSPPSPSHPPATLPEVHVDEPEALLPRAALPLNVVQQRPREVAAHAHAVGDQRRL